MFNLMQANRFPANVTPDGRSTFGQIQTPDQWSLTQRYTERLEVIRETVYPGYIAARLSDWVSHTDLCDSVVLSASGRVSGGFWTCSELTGF
ncbi:hypothetical protein DPEC_G00288110 [Dallia pectoralis]|uniref:Uncharacterized protein n=1 Tax=Dallia pectoralis TaxID=75939 RepID=A0ACC2FKM1_DALPE|nr:hypothetical protein DPEC_G00288110 [Dallia pectoralis]